MAILGLDIVVVEVGARVDVDWLWEVDDEEEGLEDELELLKIFEMTLDRFFSTGVLDMQVASMGPHRHSIYTSSGSEMFFPVKSKVLSSTSTRNGLVTRMT